MRMTEIELLKEVFRLSMGLTTLPDNYSFSKVEVTDANRHVSIEHFNRSLPSDFFMLMIDKHNNVFIDANYFDPHGDNSFISQPIYNQLKVQELLKNHTPAITIHNILDNRT